jgi:CRISPR-associated protein Cmr6
MADICTAVCEAGIQFMSRIPLCSDVAEMVGAFAEAVENRSLLLEKFIFHKKWGLDGIKHDDASRWSLLRIAERGSGTLATEAERRLRQSNKAKEQQKRETLRQEADLIKRLASSRAESRDAQTLRQQHSRRLRTLVLDAFKHNAFCVVARLESRLAINISDGLIQNAGICLDRLFGLPYIPGSAVKGVTRHAALSELTSATGADVAKSLSAFIEVFGTAENDFKQNGDLAAFRAQLPANQSLDRKGAIAFFPAYPVTEAKVVVDIINVHYPSYYKTGEVSDLAIEQPQPNPFPAVERGAAFAFIAVLNAVSGDRFVLANAKRWLEKAITENGIGAKTGAGYGWFQLARDLEEEIAQEAAKIRELAQKQAEAQAVAEAAARVEEERRAKLDPIALAQEDLLKMGDEEFAAFAKILGEKSVEQQKAFLNLLRESKSKRDRWKTWKKKKPDLAKGIQSVNKKLTLPPLP